MTDEQEQPQMMVPTDLHGLYMMGRAEVTMDLNELQLFRKYLNLIEIGKEMLPDGMSELKQSAEDLLSNPETYPETRQMEYQERNGTYRLGPGTTKTGLIEVRKEDVLIGLEEVKNQQATTLLPTIKKLDSKIFSALIENGIIEVKSPTTTDMLSSYLLEEGAIDVVSKEELAKEIEEKLEEKKKKEEEEAKRIKDGV